LQPTDGKGPELALELEVNFLLGHRSSNKSNNSECNRALCRRFRGTHSTRVKMAEQGMPGILLLSRDPKLISAMQLACGKLLIEPILCPEAAEAAALLKRRKVYAVLVDDLDRAATAELLAAVKSSRSSHRAVPIAVTDQKLGNVPHAALIATKPVSIELAARTLRVALGPMLKEASRYTRHSLRVPVMLASGFNREIQATSVNISDGGLAVQFQGTCPLPAKAQVSARLVLPSSSDVVELKGDVVWFDSDGRAGLQCKATSQFDQRVLQRWLDAKLPNTRQ
jgi:hypothetical protein